MSVSSYGPQCAQDLTICAGIGLGARNNSIKAINSLDIFNPSPLAAHLMPGAQLPICGQKPNQFELMMTLQKRFIERPCRGPSVTILSAEKKVI